MTPKADLSESKPQRRIREGIQKRWLF